MFVDPRFLGLVALCWLAFFGVPPRYRPHVLAATGVIFYVIYAPRAAWLVCAVIVLTYVLDGRFKSWILVGFLVAGLAYFKRPVGLAAAAGVSELQAGGPLVPLGFSFLAFELIHYAIERRRGKIVDRSFVDLAAFALFFPCRVAGPIKRYREFTASVREARRTPDAVTEGCLRILLGLAKKVALVPVLTRASALTSTSTSFQAWTGMLAYSLVLYVDFSAYSDLAIGVSRVLGLAVPENFYWPYLSQNIQEFWSRWHMSLSGWAREYVFSPIGRRLFKTNLRSRPGLIAAISYMSTFLVIGAWHGLRRNFLAWGAYHGTLVIGFHFYRMALPVPIASSAFYQSRQAAWAGSALTFLLVTVGWVFFRMDVPDALRVLRLMLNA